MFCYHVNSVYPCISLVTMDTESVEQMVDVAVDTYGCLDFAHNNAGILTGFAEMANIEDGHWDRLLDINLKGV